MAVRGVPAQPALPRLVAERADGALRLRWEVPGGLPFPMPVEVEVNGERRRVEMPGGRAELRVPAGTRVVVDPDARVLREAQGPVVVAGR